MAARRDKASKGSAKVVTSKNAKTVVVRRATTKPAKATKPARAAKPAKPTKLAKGAASAAKAAKALGEGDSVPAFSLVDQRGQTVSSGSLSGQPFVLYFYPKDDTPGCTREACGFRDDHRKFSAAGVRVLGVSPDKAESHARFAEKYDLNFTLLSDADKTLANAFGVWVKKQNYGREYMGIERSTFLVDARGKIRAVWHRVKVDGHVAAVLAASAATGS
jgi:thioredoxin-dependent peroxiredoxin